MQCFQAVLAYVNHVLIVIENSGASVLSTMAAGPVESVELRGLVLIGVFA
jgi:hypothetical protein